MLFLILGELLRSDLLQHLREKGVLHVIRIKGYGSDYHSLAVEIGEGKDCGGSINRTIPLVRLAAKPRDRFAFLAQLLNQVRPFQIHPPAVHLAHISMLLVAEAAALRLK